MSDIQSPFDRWLAKLIAAAPKMAWEPRDHGFASGSICVRRETSELAAWLHIVDCDGSQLPVSSIPARWLYDAARDAWASAQIATEEPAAIEDGLVYLSCRFGGDAVNLQRAVAQLARLREVTGLGLRLQAPWIASAHAELLAGHSEADFIRDGGLEIERTILAGYSAVLVDVSYGQWSPGQLREAQVMSAQGGRVFVEADGKLCQVVVGDGDAQVGVTITPTKEPTEGNSTTHRLKSWPKFFRRTRAGLKTWERRRMDRDYDVGDILVLEEYDPDSHEYTGRRERVEVTSVTQGGVWGLAADWCLMGVAPAWSQLGDLDGLEGPVYCRSRIDGTVSPGEIHEGQLYSVDVAGNDSGPEPHEDYEFRRRWAPEGSR